LIFFHRLLRQRITARDAAVVFWLIFVSLPAAFFHFS
jgi:hypothetical protein